MVDSWLVSHATPGSCPELLSALGSPTQQPGLAGAGHGGVAAPGGHGAGATAAVCGAAGSATGVAGAPGSRSGSGATTPVRKISAHEFERGGLLKPIVNTIDGTPTFLSSGLVGEAGPGAPGTPLMSLRPQRLSRNELRHLDEKELIFELVSRSTPLHALQGRIYRHLLACQERLNCT